ncbi:hypothetical protein JCM10449v2_005787 [Rhodotorula kratochvilovae]
MQARDDRPSAQDAERALAHLLFAMKQSASSPATAAAVQQSSPAQAPVAQSSPAYTPAAGSSAAPTPVATGAQTTLSSQMNTQELLMALLGQAMAAQNAQAAQATPQQGAHGAVVPTAPSASATLAASSASSSSSAAAHPAAPPPNSVYHPQPTRSGRMPQAPTHDSSVDPATLLFNDYFDFPSSDDEDDDPDFDPNAPIDDFWGDLLAGEKGDGGLTEDEGEWGGGTGSRRGLTSEEFAKELALLTSGLDDDLPPPSALGHTPTMGTRTSPRRQRAGAFDPSSSSPASGAAAPPAPPPRPSRKRPRRAGAPLSPVPEDPFAHPHAHAPPRASSPSSSSASASLPPPPSYPPTSALAFALPPPLPAAAAASDENAPPPGSASDEPDAKRKKPNQARTKYTPEEAKQRRKEQEAARAVKRRAAAKEEKEREKARGDVLERENGELKAKCAALEGRVTELEAEVGRLRSAGGGGGALGRVEEEEEEESESDGGEYQVQSSEESSDEEDDDPAEAAQDAAAYLRDVAAELDSLTDPALLSAPPGGGVSPAPPSLDLASLGSDGLSQLLALVHSAAKAQGIPLEGATPRA